MIRQQAVLPRGGKNVVREHAAPTRLPLDGGRGAPRGGDNPFMGRTFGLTNVASVPDLLLSKPWPRQPGFCPYGISQEVGSLSEKSRPDRRQDAGVLSRLCGWALVRTDRRRREQDSNHQSRRGRARRFACRFSFAPTFRLARNQPEATLKDGRVTRTDGSNPVPSSGESANHRFLSSGAYR